nr:MerR family transcriptional regulator [Eggerthella lenta]
MLHRTARAAVRPLRLRDGGAPQHRRLPHRRAPDGPPGAVGASEGEFLVKSSEIAKLAGVSVRTLRHYHAIDLLPEPPRGENGYRDYGAGDLVRLLRIKRLSSLGFSLSRISEVLDETDAHLAEAAGPNADEALDELDRELALQIERLQEQRRTIALLKREQLDPDLPVRFARAAKALIGNAYDTLPVRSGDRDALLIAGHLYTEEDIVELERTVSALGEKGLIEDLHDIQTMFDELPPDATDADIDRVIDAAMEMLDPVIDCFDPANWDSELNPQAELYIDELIRAGLNEAQARAQTQLEETLEARILAKRGAASISSSQDA